MSTTAADPRGLKRICLSCGTRYYDFNKRPVICPNCSAEFKNEIKTKGRRSRAVANDDVVLTRPAAVPAPEEAADDIVLAGDEDTVSLEEVEEEDADETLDEAGPDIVLDEEIEDLDDLDDDLDDEDDEDDEEDEDDKD